MNELKSLGISTLVMDVTDDVSMTRGVNQVIQEEGRIDVLVNNAGFGSYGAVEDVRMEDARYQMEVNVFGAARLIQLVLPYMRKHKYGRSLIFLLLVVKWLPRLEVGTTPVNLQSKD